MEASWRNSARIHSHILPVKELGAWDPLGLNADKDEAVEIKHGLIVRSQVVAMLCQ